MSDTGEVEHVSGQTATLECASVTLDMLHFTCSIELKKKINQLREHLQLRRINMSMFRTLSADCMLINRTLESDLFYSSIIFNRSSSNHPSMVTSL